MRKWFAGCLLLSGLLVVAGCNKPSTPNPSGRSRTNANTGATPNAVTPKAGQPGGNTRTSGYSGNPNAPGQPGHGAPNEGAVPPAIQPTPAPGQPGEHGATPGQASAERPGSGAASAEQFAQEAFTDDATEVRLAKLAESRAQNPDVKKFAQRMVKDHSRANEQLQDLAKKHNLHLPSDTGAAGEHQALADRLSNLKGAAFERAYIDAMVQAHEKDVRRFEQQAKNSKDPAMKEWAAKMLPILQEHLRLAKQAQKAVSGSDNNNR